MKKTTVLHTALLIYSTAALLTLLTPRAAMSQELEQKNFQVGGLDIGFLPRVYGGVMYYKYSQESIVTTDTIGIPAELSGTEVLRVSTGTAFEAEVTFPIVGGGGTFLIDRFFVDVYAQHAFSQSDTGDQSTFVSGSAGPQGAFLFTRNSITNNVDLKRTEGAVSVGYAVTDQFSLFAGYRRADTDFDNKLSAKVTFDAGTDRTAQDSTSDLKTEFEQKGPFVGFAYGVPINKGIFNGLISFDFAVAFLDGDVNQTQTNRRNTSVIQNGQMQPDSTDDDITAAIDGSTVGVNLGMHWKGFTPINGLLYMIDIVGHQYDFSADGVDVQIGGQTFRQRGDVSFDETAIAGRFGLVYEF